MADRWWKTEPWRLVQTNLREIDWEDMDAERYVASLQEFGATIVMINTGGIVANYPTALPFQPVNPHLNGDSLAKVVELCKKAGIRIIARTDFSKIREQVLAEHPDWVYRTVDGRVMDYNGNFQTCPSGAYQQVHYLETVREIIETFGVDGLYCNMGGFQFKDYSGNYYGICHCQACKDGFANFADGALLPEKEDPDNPVYQRYLAYQAQVVAQNTQRLRDFVRKLDPNVALDGVDYQRMESNTSLREMPRWQYSASSNTRCIRGTDGALMPSNTSVDFIDFSYRHIAVAPQLQRLRLWQNLSNLGGLDYYLIGRLDNHHDRSAFAAVKEVFAFGKQHQDVLQGLRSDARVLLLRKELWGKCPEERGWIRALSEGHVLFDELLVHKMDATSLGWYDAVIIPDIPGLGRQQAEWINSFCAAGGTVLATGKSVLAGQDGEAIVSRHGKRRPALECLGLGEIPVFEDGLASAMVMLDDEDKRLFTGFEDTDLAAVGDCFGKLTPGASCEGIGRYIPPHLFGPPELCAFTEVTEDPALTRCYYGKGQGICVPWRPGAFYYQEGWPGGGQLLQDVLFGVCCLVPLGTLPMQLEVSSASAEDRRVLFVCNISGHMGNSFYAPMPITVQEFAFAEPKVVREVKSLVTGEALPFRQQGEVLVVPVECPDMFEAIVLTYEAV